MLNVLRLLVLYGLVAAAAGAAARFLLRPFPPPVLAGATLLPALFLFPAFFLGKTVVPVDHALSIDPWASVVPDTRPYNPYLNDVVTQFVPWAKAARMAWKEGSFPWRDRWNGCGMALAANGQSAPFAPWTILMLALPLAQAFTFLAAVKLLLLSTGTWLWLAELGLHSRASSFGAIALAFSFTVMPWLLFPQTAVLTLFPWCLFAIERLRDPAAARRARVALLAGLVLWPLAGHVETAASCALFALVWLAARALLGALPDLRRLALSLIAVSAAAIGVTAFSLVPQVLAILASNRLELARRPFWAGLMSWAPHGTAWPALPLLLFPRWAGDGIESPTFPRSPASFSEMGLGFIGVTGALGALLILRPGSRRSRAELALLVPLAIGFGAASGLWPFAEILGILPIAKLTFPIRWLSWVAIAGAAVAAFEIDRLERDGSAGRVRLAIPILVAAGLGGAAVASYFWFRRIHGSVGNPPPPFAALAAALVPVAVALLALGWTSLANPGSIVRRALPLLLTLTLAAELLFQGKRLYRYGRPEQLFPDVPLIAFLRAQPGVFRVLGEWRALFPNANVFAGVEDVRTHDPVERRDYVEFLDRCCGYSPRDYFKEIRDVNAAALDFLNVKYLVSRPGRAAPGAKWKLVYSGRDGVVFENPAVLPRAFVEEGSAGAVDAYEEKTDSASFKAHVPPSSSVRVVTSLADDGGWSARDEKGVRLPVERRRGPFVSVRLPGGEHSVRLRYRPPGLLAGGVVSLATLFLLLVALSRAVRGRLRTSAAAAPPIPTAASGTSPAAIR